MALRLSTARLLPWHWRIVDALVVAIIAVLAYLSVVVWQSGLGDITVYYRDALAFWYGQPPLSQFPVEYPVLALVPFSFTLVPLGDAFTAFGVGMGLLNVALYAGFVRWSTRMQALACVAYLVVGEQAFMTMRYDVFPALLAVGGLWAAQRRRYPWAYLLLGLATLTKVYPALFIPLVVIAQWREAMGGDTADPTARRKAQKIAEIARAAILSPLVIGVGVALEAWRNATAVLAPLTYATHRPVQVESLLATVAWVGTWRGIPVTQVYTYGSVNWVGPLADGLVGWSVPLLVGGCLLVYLWQWRGGLPLPRAFVAVLAVTLLANRVFSTQYLIWAAPLVAEAEGWDLLWLVVFALNGLVIALYPYSSVGYTAPDVTHFLAVAAARNVLLLAVTIRMFWRGRAGQPATLAASSAATSAAESRSSIAPSSSRT